MKIFLSVGRTSSEAQENFVRRIEDTLRIHGFTPQTVGRNYFSSLQPLRAVSTLMNECVGSVIVAFERTYIIQAVEKRGAKETPIADKKLPTVWNQIEATMAYMLGHPLLVMVEEGIKPEGLLETGYDWYLLSADINQPPFTDVESTGVFADWKNRVLDNARRIEQAKNPISLSPAPSPNDELQHRLTELRKKITQYMDNEEIATLCFDLGIEYDNLKGTEKESKVRELVSFCNRSGKLNSLTALCQSMRPNVSWG
jgi:hypothetical protein